jgi:U3 small nucleolar RNA-associated protein 7
VGILDNHWFKLVEMDVDLIDETSQQTHFNGAVPLERAHTELTKADPDAAQLLRRKEAEKAYGRGRKIPGMLLHL